MFSRMIFIFGLVLPLISHATPNHLGTPAQRLKAKLWNQTHATVQAHAPNGWSPLRPFSEIENTGYVAISGDNNFEMADLRLAIAQNLPAGVVLIVYVGDSGDVPSIKNKLSRYLSSTQLKFLVVPESFSSDPTWARDSLPFPIYLAGSTAGATQIGLVNSLYPQDFEPDQEIASALSLPMFDTNQYFRGGNLLMDMNGNCFTENVNETADLNDPESFLKINYGCASVTLMNHQGGIGDIDERIKFLSGNTVLSDDASYAAILKGKGYNVTMMPSTGRSDETYMNTLYVNGTIFVPQMGLPSDSAALAAYQKLGMKPVGVMTKQMADDGLGNIHCVTMNYPPGTFNASPLGSDFVQFAH